MSFLGGVMSGFSKETDKDSKTKQRVKDAIGKIKSKIKGKPQTSASVDEGAGSDFPSYKRGGRVKKTGLARLHKGERVLTTRQAKRFRGRSKGRY